MGDANDGTALTSARRLTACLIGCAGETWRRQVNVSDGTGPVDPTDVTAVLCPEVPIVVT